MATVTKTETPETVPVEKWNGQKVRFALDDAVKEAFKKHHYEESHTYTDIKLFFSFLAVAIAGFGLAYSYFIPFPQCRTILGVCVGLYFVITTVVQGVAWFYEGNILMWVYKVMPADGKEKSKSVPAKLEVHSQMGRYSTDYTLSLVDPMLPKGNNSVKVTKSIGFFVDWEGNLYNSVVEGVVGDAIADLLKKYGKKAQ
eukprot:comp19164_c0_seq1/m.21849 comp19164_c0_seq1/g.21849  ORF comp19164_c0_seq1/g.21849 comp19164_c0_seq1/m.21849 type:complete len:199 (-) comp19164_c0_seq1:349-945(-)